MDYNEIDLIDFDDDYEDEALKNSKSFKYDMELEISGILIENELDALMKLCSEENERSLPLYLNFSGERAEIGFLELSLDNLLNINYMSPNYSLVLIDNLNNNRRSLNSSDPEVLGDILSTFISIV